jgi:hypothetical protein
MVATGLEFNHGQHLADAGLALPSGELQLAQPEADISATERCGNSA